MRLELDACGMGCEWLGLGGPGNAAARPFLTAFMEDRRLLVVDAHVSRVALHQVILRGVA